MWKFSTYETNQPINWAELEAHFSWFREMQNVPQDPIWHAEGDVHTHTKMVVKALTQLPEYQALDEQDQHILFAAALMHDIEKRSTTTTEIIDQKSRIVSPRHAKKGESTTRTILYQEIPTPFTIREQITKLVRLHGLPLWAITKTDPAKEVIRASLVVNTQHLAILAKADILGRTCQDQDDILLKIELFKELCKENKCWGHPRAFPTDLARFQYFQKKDGSPDYVPFDDLKFEVIMMSALPGSGKDTYIQKHLDLPVLSLDDIRRKRNISPKDKKGNGQVIQIAKETAKKFMRKQESFIFNATNLTKDMRNKWIALFNDYHAKITIIYIEVPYQQLIAQNHNRDHKVPEKAVEKMIRKLEIPTLDEAHSVHFFA